MDLNFQRMDWINDKIKANHKGEVSMVCLQRALDRTLIPVYEPISKFDFRAQREFLPIFCKQTMALVDESHHMHG